MKKDYLKTILIFVITVATVFWALKFFYSNSQRSKAAGETMTLSFDPATKTIAANTDFTVTIKTKPSLNTVLRGYKTKVNFDKAILKFKSIEYKLGTASLDLADTTASVDTVAARETGVINVIGEVGTAVGTTITSGTVTDLVTVTFTAVTNVATTVTVSESDFYSTSADTSLFNTWTYSPEGLSVNGGVLPSPTPTGVGTGESVKLNAKLKFQGITSKRPNDALNTMITKFTLYDETSNEKADYDLAGVTSNDNGVWSGVSDMTVNTDHKFSLLVKGPYHIQKKVCDVIPAETAGGTYRCARGNITLVAGVNNLDFSGILQLAGDLSEQDGTVSSYDISLVRNCIGKTDETCLNNADVNRDGKVDTQDYSLIIAALSVKNDEL